MEKNDAKYTLNFDKERDQFNLVKDGTNASCGFRGPVQIMDLPKLVGGKPEIKWANVLCETICPHFHIQQDKDEKRKNQVAVEITCGAKPLTFPIRNPEIMQGRNAAIQDPKSSDNETATEPAETAGE